MRRRLKECIDTGAIRQGVALFLSSLLWLSIAIIAEYASAAGVRPNVIIVLTDDQGHGDLGFHQNANIQTPHLDTFAIDSVRLERFYCSPVCAPTRASLMTGRYYYRTGVIHTSRGGAKMDAAESTLAELMSEAGYKTALFGKWHLGDTYPMRPQDQGFARALWHRSGGIGQSPDQPNPYQDPRLWANNKQRQYQGYCTDIFTDAAIEFIERNRDEPFFAYIAYNAPHTPLEIADEQVQPNLEKGLDDTTARVYAMVENIDDNFGRIVDTLSELGLRDNTLLFFLTDNGPQQSRYNSGMRGRKSWIYEGGIRVPCFVQWPAEAKGHKVVDSIAAHIDLTPTILDVCGIDIPTDMDGVSLADRLFGDTTASSDRALFFQCHRGLTPNKYQNCAVVTQRYKLVSSPGTFSDESLPADDLGHDFELYDLQSDPGEQYDLSTESPVLLERLKRRYDEWWRDVSESRDFRPGTIVIGAVEEPSTQLCRYQDGTFIDGISRGWQVRIARPGTFRVEMPNRPTEVGVLFIKWNGTLHQHTILTKSQSVEVFLDSGEGNLDIWYQPRGKSRAYITDNSTAGDVLIRWTSQ